MLNGVKSTLLGLGLLAGVASGAYAQTDNIAAVPPGAQAPSPPAAAVAPAPSYVGPKPGDMWSTREQQTGPVVKSPDSIGGPRPN